MRKVFGSRRGLKSQEAGERSRLPGEGSRERVDKGREGCFEREKRRHFERKRSSGQGSACGDECRIENTYTKISDRGQDAQEGGALAKRPVRTREKVLQWGQSRCHERGGSSWARTTMTSARR